MCIFNTALKLRKAKISKISFSVFNRFIEGYYIYHESDNVPNGKRARLLSPLITSTATEMCVQFRYYMYGADGDNTLRVLTRRDSGEEEIWSKKGIVSPSWKLGSVTVSKPASEKITVSMHSLIRTFLEAGLTSYWS